jgi:hypothetical protein
MVAHDAPADGVVPEERHRARTVIAAVTGVLAVLVLTVTLVAVWARATVLRSEIVGELAGDALAESDVQAGLAGRLADEVSSAVDLEGLLAGALPDSLDRFAPLIASGVNEAVERAITRALSEPAVQETMVALVERAHDAAIDLLRGDGLIDGISVADGQVTLNTLPLVTRGLEALQSVGLLQDVELPTITRDGDPDEQIAELSAALDRDLPADFGQVVVYEGAAVSSAQETVENARRMLALAQRALVLALVITALLMAVTILVAPRRSRAVLVLALGTAAAMVVLRAAVRRVVADAPELADTAAARAAVKVIVGGAAQSVLRLAAVVGVVAAIGAIAVVLLTHRRRADLVLVAAVAAGALTLGVLGFSIWALLAGVVVGVAVFWLLGSRFGGKLAPTTAGP